MSDLPEPVRAFLDQGGEQVVLVSPGVRVVGNRDVAGIKLPAPELSGKYARVLTVVHDRTDLRAAVLPHAVRAPVVAVWVVSLPSSPGFVPRPEWPPMKAFRTQPVADGYLVVARFEQPVRAANVVRELGFGSVAVLAAGFRIAILAADALAYATLHMIRRMHATSAVDTL